METDPLFYLTEGGIKTKHNSRYRKARADERKYFMAQERIEKLLNNNNNEGTPGNLDDFCRQNGIRQSKSGNSFYFRLNGKSYRVSDHTEQYSNVCSRDLKGRKIRKCYHGKTSRTNTILAQRSEVKRIYEEIKYGKLKTS